MLATEQGCDTIEVGLHRVCTRLVKCLDRGKDPTIHFQIAMAGGEAGMLVQADTVMDVSLDWLASWMLPGTQDLVAEYLNGVRTKTRSHSSPH